MSRTLTMTARVLTASVLSLSMLLAGCNPFIGKEPPSELFNLTPKSTFPDDTPQVEWQLVIEEPIAARGLDTPRIAVRPTVTRLQYLAGARWTNRAPLMVHTLLVESFENSGKIVAVGRQAIGLRSEYSLRTELREFQVEYFDVAGNGLVRVRLNAKLVSQVRQKIVASQTFEEVVNVTAPGKDAIVTAFDAALGAVLKQLVYWTLSTPGTS